jgi:hypothetical protein
MRRIGPLVLTAFLAGLPLQAVPVTLVFSGVDASAQPVRASLLDPATKESAWVAVGGRFAGCEVRAYDAARRTLSLARGAETWELAMVAPRAASDAPSPAEVAQITKEVTNNLRQLDAAREQHFLEKGVTTVRFDQLVGPEPGKYIKWINPADGEDYTGLDFTAPATGKPPLEWTIVTKRGVTVRHKPN